MNCLRIAIASGLLALGATVAYSQEPRDDAKPPQHEQETRQENNREARPARQDDARPQREEKQQQEQERQRPDRNDRRNENSTQQREEARPAPQQHGEHAQGEHRDRAAGRGTRIPEDKFRTSFGRQHTFVINRPVVVEGEPRFQYSGYWFEMMDPWPSDWMYTDDVYVEYVDDGYYLFDMLHPGMRVAVFVAGM